MKHSGQKGEELAIQFLTEKGYHILEHNFKVIFGEIDIIAKKNHSICFVEVKSRKSRKFGLPEEAITEYKKKKIIRVAQYYIKQKDIKNSLFRFDVVSIQLNERNQLEIRHIRDAFSAC